MSGWKTALNFMRRPLMETGKSIGGAVIHPQRTLYGLGTAAKTAVVGGGMGYLAWENIVNDKPVLRTIGDTLVGEETVDKVDEYKVVSAFDPTKLPDYAAYAPADCPMCKQAQKLDALVNSYGYSKL